MLDGLQKRPAADPRERGSAVPRDCDDVSCDDVITVPRSHDSGGYTSHLVAEIEERLELLDDELAKVAPIVHERERLLVARAQLLGEPPPRSLTAARRASREDVASVLRSHPGIRAGEIARVLGVGQPAISAHLYRGKDSRFRSRGGRWFLRGEQS